MRRDERQNESDREKRTSSTHWLVRERHGAGFGGGVFSSFLFASLFVVSPRSAVSVSPLFWGSLFCTERSSAVKFGVDRDVAR